MPMSNSISIEFPDNGGRVTTRLELASLSTGSVDVVVHYGGKSYASRGGGPSELGEEHQLSGGPIECSAQSLLRLAASLDEWLTSGTLFEWHGGHEQGPRLKICLCRPVDVITTRDKPALSFEYSNAGFFSASWKYVVDRTCLEPPKEGLESLPVQGSES
jgi:hypothetical protein